MNKPDDTALLHIYPMSSFRGESVATWFEGFFRTVIALSTLGASITFNFVVSDIRTLFQRHPFNKTQVQRFLAISWLLFVLSLAWATFFASVLNFFRADAVQHWGEGGARKKLIQWYATSTSAFLYGLVIAAFMFLSLVITAYTGSVGWIALAFTTFFGLLGLGCILYQAPLWRTSRYR